MEDIKHLFDDRLIIAHSYGTKKAVLNHCFEIYNILKLNVQFECTLKLSKNYLDLENHKLSTVAKYFNIEQNNYHNALEDAIVCGKVYHKLMTNNYQKIKKRINRIQLRK